MTKSLTILTATLALGALLAGCSAAVPTSNTHGTFGPTGAIQAEPTVDMIARLAITGANGYKLLATETAFNLGDIDHVTLTLQKYETATASWADVSGFAAKKVARADLGAALTLKNLRMATQYKVVAKAYSGADEAVAANRIDNAVATDNETTFTTPSLVVGSQLNSTNGNNIDIDARTFTAKVQLKDKTFAGQATDNNGIDVTNGTIVNTNATETF